LYVCGVRDQTQDLEPAKQVLYHGATTLPREFEMIYSLKLDPGAHAYTPSYSGGRDQKDCNSKPAQANSSRDPNSKKSITKKGWWSGSR
jgi:hypothetical protein